MQRPAMSTEDARALLGVKDRRALTGRRPAYPLAGPWRAV